MLKKWKLPIYVILGVIAQTAGVITRTVGVIAQTAGVIANKTPAIVAWIPELCVKSHRNIPTTK